MTVGREIQREKMKNLKQTVDNINSGIHHLEGNPPSNEAAPNATVRRHATPPKSDGSSDTYVAAPPSTNNKTYNVSAPANGGNTYVIPTEKDPPPPSTSVSRLEQGDASLSQPVTSSSVPVTVTSPDDGAGESTAVVRKLPFSDGTSPPDNNASTYCQV